jgi:hypothetical protein
VLLSSIPSVACDRALSPFETDLPLGAAVADTIAVVRVVSVETLTVELVKSLKGKPKSKFSVRGFPSPGLARNCGFVPLEAGKEYIVLLFNPVSENDQKTAVYSAIDTWAGALEHTATTRKQILQALSEKRVVSVWSKSANGVQSRLMFPKSIHGNETNVLVVLRNVSNSEVTFHYSDWPQNSQSHCSMNFVDVKAKAKVEPKTVPIERSVIEAYFSKNPRNYDIKIPVGSIHLHLLPRVTTAEPGWGHKEELGFEFYPIPRPGIYEASAACVNFFGKGSTVQTPSVQVQLE